MFVHRVKGILNKVFRLPGLRRAAVYSPHVRGIQRSSVT